MPDVEKWAKELTEYIECHVDEIGKMGDSAYVPLTNSLQKVYFLEYGKKSKSIQFLVSEAKDWLFNYSNIKRNTFSGHVDKPSKTVLYWRVKPKFRYEPIQDSYTLYFRIYIDTK